MNRKAPWAIARDKDRPEKKRWGRIPSRSKLMNQRMKEYRRVKDEWLARYENYFCEVYPNERATQVHHSRGRAGKLLTNTKYFHAVSQKGHLFIHANPDLARKRGLLAQAGDWNRQ